MRPGARRQPHPGGARHPPGARGRRGVPVPARPASRRGRARARRGGAPPASSGGPHGAEPLHPPRLARRGPSRASIRQVREGVGPPIRPRAGRIERTRGETRMSQDIRTDDAPAPPSSPRSPRPTASPPSTGRSSATGCTCPPPRCGRSCRDGRRRADGCRGRGALADAEDRPWRRLLPPSAGGARGLGRACRCMSRTATTSR